MGVAGRSDARPVGFSGALGEAFARVEFAGGSTSMIIKVFGEIGARVLSDPSADLEELKSGSQGYIQIGAAGTF